MCVLVVYYGCDLDFEEHLCVENIIFSLLMCITSLCGSALKNNLTMLKHETGCNISSFLKFVIAQC